MARPGEARVADQAPEHGADVVAQQPGAGCGGEEARAAGRVVMASSIAAGASCVAASRVAGERINGARVHRDLAGLAELAVADGEQPLLEVHIVAVESDRLALPHAFSGGSGAVAGCRPIRVILPVVRWFSAGALLVAGSRCRPS